MTAHRFTNRLAAESSPYLRQHAHNPVDWYPWGPEALRRARDLDRPIFLSIGYSACHWCHVMEHESFENEAIAQLLNDHFVSIKVDREERPDLDQIYMASVQMISGQGGWPMSVFLTPELRPFTGGTYFPPEDRYGRPGFRRILQTLAEAWRTRRDDIDRAADDVTDQLQKLGQLPAGPGALSDDLLRNAGQYLARAYDPVHGGFGQAPKFPHPMDLRLLLRLGRRFGDAEATNMARHTLDRMALGGIWDHLGGGFARYSTDARWLAPHFEKMLYDNALLTVAYLEAYQATGEAAYRETVEQTLEWVRREMTSPDGPFYSTLDADSEGEEGKFYVWRAEEIEAALGADATLFNACYGVSPKGNWADPHHPGVPKNILHRTQSFAELAARCGTTEAELRATLAAGRAKLLAVRERRVRPGLDDKTLTAWNGLMITALATAAAVVGRPEYAERAARAADFLLTRMRTPEGRLLRTCSPGHAPKLNGYLEDHAYLLEGLVALYAATFEPRWIDEALRLATVMIDEFWDPVEGGFFYTGRNHEALIARGKDPHDNATPAANSVAVTALLRLVKLTGRPDLQDRAETTLKLYAELMDERPFATAQMLLALDFYLGPVQEFAIVGDPADAETRRVLSALYATFRPNKVVALRPPAGPVREDLLPLLAGRQAVDGRVTTYVCENFACQAPLVGADAAAQALAQP
ncbi:MAG: thioredoxin domain-containing protein [Gemmataceae bacterium]